MERQIHFRAAYDKRPKAPTDPNYGIHGVEIQFVLKGTKGATQFLLYTNWQLPHVTQERCGRRYDAIDGDAHWMERPLPADIGYHSPVPLWDGQESLTDNCLILGGRCYYDGSSLNAEPVYHRLLAEGDAGVWAALEEYYTRTFGDLT